MRNLILFLLLHISVIINAQTCPEVPISNQTYLISTTLAGCTVNLENVTVANNATLIVNSEQGITISGEFNVNAGSSFETGFAQTFVPTLDATTSASVITSNSATSGGNITYDGGATVTARGICWATTQNPTTANSTYACGTGTGSFTGNLTGLSANTTYYVCSYATNSAGTAYGAQISFTTSAAVVLPLVTTTTVSSITCNSAISGGSVTSDGYGTVTARGICWFTTQNPTTANSTCPNGSGTGTYTCNLTGLIAGTT